MALIHSMRLSLTKGAHADLSSTAWQEIGVKPGFACPACPGMPWSVPWGLSGISALDVRLPVCRARLREEKSAQGPGYGKVRSAWWKPPHSCGGARLSSRAGWVGLISSGFSRGGTLPTQRPMLISRFFWCMNWTTTLAVCSVSHCSLVMG